MAKLCVNNTCPLTLFTFVASIGIELWWENRINLVESLFNRWDEIQYWVSWIRVVIVAVVVVVVIVLNVVDAIDQ